MRLKDDDMASITPEQLHDLFTALDFTRKDVARICGLSEFAPGRWRQAGRIPLIHLKRLWDELQAKLKGRKDLTPVEKRAQQYMWKQFDLNRVSGSAIPVSPDSPFYSAVTPHLMNLNAALSFNVENKDDQFNQLLKAISLEDLLHEIGRRGFKVQLEPKE